MEIHVWRRILLPIRKIRLPEEQVSRPIPTLSDRQFIVAKSNLSDEEEKTQRELFWYREELFKCVRGHWKEANTVITGYQMSYLLHPDRTAEVATGICHYGGNV